MKVEIVCPNCKANDPIIPIRNPNLPKSTIGGEKQSEFLCQCNNCNTIFEYTIEIKIVNPVIRKMGIDPVKGY